MEPVAPVIVIGGGPAGLATGACLARRGIPSLILDRFGSVGASWAVRYDRLHLHTPRIQSHLPGYRIPPAAGRWVSRDAMVAYLRAYAAHHRLRVQLGEEAERVDRLHGHFRVTTTAGERTARNVVVATGYNQDPYLPDWPGRDGFAGELLHAADYRGAAQYRGREVLVVGSGNTGAEIAADLAEQGARRVWISVRTAPNVIPRQVGPLPVTLLGIFNDYLPAPLVDPVNRVLQRLTMGDLTKLGLPAPRQGLVAQVRRTDVIPTIDVGLVGQLRQGRVEPVAGVKAFHGGEVELEDGTLLAPEVVIAATGYRRTLDRLLGHLGVLDGAHPGVPAGRSSLAVPGLFFVGLSNPLKGLLLQISLDARSVARSIARLETSRR
jgi:putative flavoprotein involved in K+ transport